MNKVIVVAGPTASGKTGLGIFLAKNLNGEIVSADSMQIYEGMDIASAKPTKEEMENIPHHLISQVSMSENFDVFTYVEMAKEKIRDIVGRGKTPIIVGGTGMYISNLIYNIDMSKVKTDLKLREKLECDYDLLGGKEMLNRLAQVDIKTAEKLHENDKKRIVRGLEVYYSSGKTMSESKLDSQKSEKIFDAKVIILSAQNREVLYDRINRRVDKMLEDGLLDEVKREYNEANRTSSKAIGHKEFIPYLDGKITLEQAKEELKMQTRRYAKRQITWFKKMEDTSVYYIDNDCKNEILEECKEFLRRN